MSARREPSDGRGLPTLLLVEDDPDLGPLIERMLQEEYAVTLVRDGEAGLSTGLRGDFDVLVLDRRLPGLDGVSMLQSLRRAGVRSPAVMLTALGSVADRVGGLDAGADDYVVKPFDFAELSARLRAARRVHGDAEDVVFIGDWEFMPGSRIINSPYDGRRVLTDTETQLLLYLAQHRDETVSRERILRHVFPAGDSVATVDTYVHYLRRKTEKELITTVRGRGYRLGE